MAMRIEKEREEVDEEQVSVEEILSYGEVDFHG
jgi:hypothetical protein